MARAKKKTTGKKKARSAAPKRRRRARRAGKPTQLAFEALAIEGGLLSADWLARAAQLEAGGQTEADYRVPKGLSLRDEIGRFWRIGQALWGDFTAGKDSAGSDEALLSAVAERHVTTLLRDCFGFGTLVGVEPEEVDGRVYPIGHWALDGRVPVVVAPAGAGLDALSPTFGDGTRRRSAFGLCQEYLNAEDAALWGLVSDGAVLRVLRDNASLTRPAWIAADLGRIFEEERYSDFAALWLLIHETRFGRPDQPVTECSLEAWREAGREEGTRAREQLRHGVEEALVALGRGFLAHPENQAIRAALSDGTLTTQAYFQELLRLAYRLIFLLTVEERGVLHPDGSDEKARQLYSDGYSVRRLRERAIKRSSHDRNHDHWETLKIVLGGLAEGEPLLALPALAGIFAKNQCPTLDRVRLENRFLMLALFRLSWLREDSGLARVNWRDMGPEELGSVYESLLELVPQITEGGRGFSFATGAETKGHARKTTGSYYTPDSLVQVLLDSALEPVVERTIAEHPTDTVEALLSLSIVDPACGSGHFLLAAARRLAAHVARLEADGTPSAAEYRHALRQVVGRCIYGVDLNPMAVELCKVSLWMEAVEPGLPLTFLDSHIRHGNALLGATPQLMAKGIPDDAWKPLEGDDKKVASALRKRNKAAAEGQRGLDTLWSKPKASEADELRKAVGELEAASDDDASGLAEKELRWQALLDSEIYQHQKLVADAWCAAFVWPKQPGPLAEAAPTNDLWRQLRDGQGNPSDLTVATVGELAEHYSFFHWHLAFPQVVAHRGFSVILSNPPWDRVTLEEKEWFAATRPDIASAATATKRRTLIKALETESPEVFRLFKESRRRVDGEKAFVGRSGRSPLSAQGILNTYPLFTEAALSLISSHGRIGIIVPTGIATAKGVGDLFRSIVDAGRLRSLRDFHNRLGIFPAVQRNMRFCLVTLSGDSGNDILVTAQASEMRELHDTNRHCFLSVDDIARVNPETHHLPLFATRRDAEVVRAIYLRNKSVVEEYGESDHRSVKFLRMLNTADDSAAFMPLDPNTFAESDASSWTPHEVDGRTLLPLYEAKLLDQYNHRSATFVGTNANKRYGLHAGAVQSTDSRLSDAEYVSVPRYWVAADVLPQDLARPFLLVYRDAVSAVADARCLSAAFVPWGGVGDTLKIAFCGDNATDLVILATALNSFVVDYVFRQKSSSSHASAFILRQLPLPQLGTFDSECPWDARESVVSWLSARLLELTFTAWDLVGLADCLGYGGPPFRWDARRREGLRAEIDAALFLLYGLPRADAAHVLEGFPIVRRRDEEAHGEYRTKRNILEIYDEMADAARSGKPCQTRLDPPPADPRVAHPPRKLKAEGR